MKIDIDKDDLRILSHGYYVRIQQCERRLREFDLKYDELSDYVDSDLLDEEQKRLESDLEKAKEKSNRFSSLLRETLQVTEQE